MTFKVKAAAIGGLCLILFSASLLFSESTEIKADFSKLTVKIKPESIRGVNVNNSMQIAAVRDKIKLMKIPTITYPAGNIGDESDMNNKANLSFFSLQQGMLGNPFTFVQVRVFNGTVEGAVNSIPSAATNDVRVDVWSIGNEPDLYYRNNAPDWTSDKYNKVFREYVTAMKKTYPNLKAAGPMVSQPKDDWIKSFIKENGDLVDVMAWHWYPTDGSWSDPAAIGTAPMIVDQIKRYREWLKDPAMNPKGYNRDIKLALTEYAIHWNTPKATQLADMTGAIWTAEVMGYLAQSQIDYSHYFCLGAYGGHAVFEPNSNIRRPVYYVFAFYGSHFGDQMVSASSSDNEVKTFASIDSDGIKHLIVINENASDSKELSITLEGLTQNIKNVKGFLLSKESNGKDMDPKLIKKAFRKLTVSMPAFSVAAFDIE